MKFADLKDQKKELAPQLAEKTAGQFLMRGPRRDAVPPESESGVAGYAGGGGLKYGVGCSVNSKAGDLCYIAAALPVGRVQG